MAKLEQTYEIAAPIAKVWQALVDPTVIAQWGGGPAEMNDKAGTKFTLWGGDIFGKNTEVIPEKLLVQEWGDDELKEPSIVSFELTEKAGKTVLRSIFSGLRAA